MEGRRGLGEQPITHSIAKPVKLGPEHNIWYWHPFRAGVKSCPDWFQEKLDAVAPGIAVTWNPIIEKWQVWERAPRLQHPICTGWKLLFVHWDQDHGYLPLDERLIARLYACSVMANGSAKAYLDRVLNEMERDRIAAQRQADQDHIDECMPFFDHSQISVAMRGPSNGSKFSTYHA